MTAERVAKGDRFVFGWSHPKCFVLVTRVGRDGTWADIRVYMWDRTWTKRQPLGRIKWEREDWKMSDIQASTPARLREPS